LAQNTSVAIIQNASLSNERHVACTLDHLHETLIKERLGSPSVIVIGQVLTAFANQLALEAQTMAASPMKQDTA
jgi:uroporphyrin-III C-methyltransferase